METTLPFEQREHARIGVPEYLVSFDQIACRGFGDLQDISQGGLRFKTMAKVELGAVSVLLKLPSFQKRKKIQGEVVWVDENAFTCGISFHLPLDENLTQ